RQSRPEALHTRLPPAAPSAFRASSFHWPSHFGEEHLLEFTGYGFPNLIADAKPAQIKQRQYAADNKHCISWKPHPFEQRIQTAGEVRHRPGLKVAVTHRFVQLQNPER